MINNEAHWNTYDQSAIGVGAYTDLEALVTLTKNKVILEVGSWMWPWTYAKSS
jgi:hypothetical protein